MTGMTSNSCEDTLTVSLRAIEIPEIALWIYSFIESDEDKASFSAVRRNVYHSLLEHRVKSVQIGIEGLPSFALLLQNSTIARSSCTSLKIRHYPHSDQIFDVKRAFWKYCVALTLRATGEFGILKHFSGRLSGWYPEAWVLSKMSALKSRHTKQVNAQFGDVKASKKELYDALATLHQAGDQLTTELRKSLSDFNLKGDVDAFKSTSTVLNELQKSAVSLEELHIGFSLDAWRCLCSGQFPVLRRLELTTSGDATNIHSGFHTPLLEGPIPTNAFERLEALKLVTHNRDSPVLLLSIKCPHLKLFEVGGTGGGGSDREASLSAIESFIESHATLEAVSLANHFVPSTIKDSQKITALQFILPKIRHIPKFPVAMRLPSVRHVRLIFACQEMFFAEIPSKDSMRHIRCLELRFHSMQDSIYMLEGPFSFDREQQVSASQNPSPLTKRLFEIMSVFSELVELAIHLHIPNKSVLAVPTDVYVISQILAGCCSSDSLLAIKYKNDVSDGLCDNTVNAFDVPIAPPNLRFIAMDIDGKEELYDTQSSAGGKVAIRRPFRRQFPVKGKWTVDFTDESIFNHFTGDYSKPQM
ncbi:hypothetical protein SCHPADRAFT_994263 [Schizopora paradoxa]|uniref:Uncharacterized protein n=1 Tax=Schizopora paradoxa TaxID=27342 RepID=A0A0H2S7F6_9AGAM|nr:hypothetical protein SCHPADRAFT_994263 [Schizopora paradoxa]